MAGYKLQNDWEEEPFVLIGIATAQKEHKLCFFLNQILSLDFRRLADLEFQSKERTIKIQFPVFLARSDDGKYVVDLFVNKQTGESLLPEANRFDYLLRIKGKLETEQINTWMADIRQIKEVVLCSEINTRKMKKNLERLLYQEPNEQTQLSKPRNNLHKS